MSSRVLWQGEIRVPSYEGYSPLMLQSVALETQNRQGMLHLVFQGGGYQGRELHFFHEFFGGIARELGAADRTRHNGVSTYFFALAEHGNGEQGRELLLDKYLTFLHYCGFPHLLLLSCAEGQTA